MSATTRDGGKAQTTVDKDGNVTQTRSGNTGNIHQSTGNQVIRGDEVTEV